MSAPNLTGVPETMLWTLHNRAAEARRPDTFLHDPNCVRIHAAIDYDYQRSFGQPDTSHPMRSAIFDQAVKPWMVGHPGATVVELAAGLETQFQRCDDGKVQWMCVDLPESLAVRERFLPATTRCRHLAASALDPAWMDAVDARQPVFVTAQGLFMYFEPAQVQRLFAAMAERFPSVQIMFDTIPPWFSRKTLRGFGKTRHYTAPPMPWGVKRDDIEALLRSWSPHVHEVAVRPYGAARGPAGLFLKTCCDLPGVRNLPPCIVLVSTQRR